jgi:Tfp pilus assembly protein PilF/TolB-like protein
LLNFFPRPSSRSVFFLLALCTVCSSALLAQAPGTNTLLVMPFENHSKAPGLEWISAAFPEVLSERMVSPQLYLISREDRLYAFDHAGIPGAAHPSRATTYSVAEQMDADYVVFGDYDFDGTVFIASAQLLDMKRLRLGKLVQSKGPLTSLIDIQTDLAWQLLNQLPMPPAITREQFLKASQPLRLDALENYIRGILATNRQQQTRYFREAIRLNPNYTLAMLQLGRIYYGAHEYESASLWLGRIPKDDVVAGEANFLLGMAEFYRGNYDKAYAAFSFIATRVPLTEVYNNLGVVEARRARRTSAIDLFTRAVNADPSDPDYRFNLAVALYKNGDNAGAAQQLREELQRRPNDAEAKSLLENINRGVSAPMASASGAQLPGMPPGSGQVHVPLERIKRNYDEASYRQLQLEIHNLTEERLAKSDRKAHSVYHSDRGKDLLARNNLTDAEAEFREAIQLDYNNAAAHAGMARAMEQKGDTFNARSEAQTSVRLQPNVDAYLVLARLSLKQNQLEAASDAVKNALKLEPSNSAVQALQRDLTAKQSAPH